MYIFFESELKYRSDSGRQALLVLCHFPEVFYHCVVLKMIFYLLMVISLMLQVVSVLLDTLRSYTELEPTVKRNGIDSTFMLISSNGLPRNLLVLLNLLFY